MDDPAELCIHESDIPNECFEPIFDEAKPKHVELHPATLRFLFCMVFSVYEVIRVAWLSRSWFVYSSWETCAEK